MNCFAKSNLNERHFCEKSLTTLVRKDASHFTILGTSKWWELSKCGRKWNRVKKPNCAFI